MQDSYKTQSTMRILVVDDHRLFADGLGFVLHSIAEKVEIVIVNDSQNALEELDSNPNIDLLLLDMHMPGFDGISLLISIKERQMLIPCVIVSATEDVCLIKQALDLGAFGFVPKSYNSDQLISALNMVINGDTFIPDEIIRKINRLNQNQNLNANKIIQSLKQLGITKRQYEVLILMAKGYSNQKIANTLFLSKHTVKSHVAALLGAFQSENRTECVRQGRDCGLLN